MNCLVRFSITVSLIGLATVGQAKDYASSDQPLPMAMRNLPFGRSFDASTSGTINPNPRVARPKIITKAEWGGAESSGTMRSHFPSRLTFHHEGSNKPAKPGDDAPAGLRALQKYGWSQKGWADLPYHFLVDADGRIYAGRDPMKVGDTNTKYDPSGHLLLTVIGNYEIQAANEKQLTAICDLMAWLCDYYNINPESLRGHMEYADTQCPGKYLYPFVASGFFEGEVRRRLRAAYAP